MTQARPPAAVLLPFGSTRRSCHHCLLTKGESRNYCTKIKCLVFDPNAWKTLDSSEGRSCDEQGWKACVVAGFSASQPLAMVTPSSFESWGWKIAVERVSITPLLFWLGGVAGTAKLGSTDSWWGARCASTGPDLSVNALRGAVRSDLTHLGKGYLVRKVPWITGVGSKIRCEGYVKSAPAWGDRQVCLFSGSFGWVRSCIY